MGSQGEPSGSQGPGGRQAPSSFASQPRPAAGGTSRGGCFKYAHEHQKAACFLSLKLGHIAGSISEYLPKLFQTSGSRSSSKVRFSSWLGAKGTTTSRLGWSGPISKQPWLVIQSQIIGSSTGHGIGRASCLSSAVWHLPHSCCFGHQCSMCPERNSRKTRTQVPT